VTTGPRDRLRAGPLSAKMAEKRAGLVANATRRGPRLDRDLRCLCRPAPLITISVALSGSSTVPVTSVVAEVRNWPPRLVS